MQQVVQNLVEMIRPSLEGNKLTGRSQAEKGSFKNFLSLKLKEGLGELAEILKLPPAQAREELNKMDLVKLKSIEKLLNRLLKRYHLLRETDNPVVKELLLPLVNLKTLLNEVMTARKKDLPPPIQSKSREINGYYSVDKPTEAQLPLRSEDSKTAVDINKTGDKTNENAVPRTRDAVSGKIQGSNYENDLVVIKNQETGSEKRVSTGDNLKYSFLKPPDESQSPPVKVEKNPDTGGMKPKIEQGDTVNRANLSGEVAKETSEVTKKQNNGHLLKSDNLTEAGKFNNPDSYSKTKELTKIGYTSKADTIADNYLEPGNRKPETGIPALNLKEVVVNNHGIKNFEGYFIRGEAVELVAEEKFRKKVTGHDGGKILNLVEPSRPNPDYLNSLSGKDIPTYRANMQGLIEQLSRVIRIYNGGNHQQIRIQLEPEELGKIKLDLRVKDGEVLARLTVENQGVKDYLEQNMTGLRNSLSRQGLNLEQFEIHTEDGFEPEYKEDMRGNQHSSQQQEQNSRNYQREGDFGFSLDEVEFPLELQGLEDNKLAGHYWMMLNHSYHRMNLLA